MSIIRPIISIRPNPNMVEVVSSPPTSVLSTKKVEEIVSTTPYNFTNIQRPEIKHPQISTEDEIAQKAKEELDNCIENNAIITEEKPCFYLYRIKNESHEQTGLVACASINEFNHGFIKPHEQTRIEKEPIIQKHILATKIQANPVMLAYESRKDINEYIEKLKFVLDPINDFTDSFGFSHTVWMINESKYINDLIELYENIDALYIADGHHRASATAHLNHENDNLFSIIYAHDQLKTLEFNRVVNDLNGYTPRELVNELSKDFDINVEIDATQPKSNLRFGMYLDGTWYSLSFKKPERLVDKNWVEKLNVSILQENVLAPILGIKNPKIDQRIDFINGALGIKKVQKLIDQDKAKVAFILSPISVNEIMRIADENLFMPPKSTWFEPKLRNGLFSYHY